MQFVFGKFDLLDSLYSVLFGKKVEKYLMNFNFKILIFRIKWNCKIIIYFFMKKITFELWVRYYWYMTNENIIKSSMLVKNQNDKLKSICFALHCCLNFIIEL